MKASDPGDYRYERKFFVSELTRYEIEALVKLHPAMFLEVYEPRFINNLYFDSPNMQNYFSNVDGLKDRIKVRVRWYGDLFGCIEKPVLEIKIKNGLLGRKESFSLTPFTIDETLQLATLMDVFTESAIPYLIRADVIALEVSLLNRYRRKYFLSADRNFRITIDSEMEYYHVGAYNNTFAHKSTDLISTVLELKYDPAMDQSVHKISSRFPFRISKSSKYVNGIERAYL